MTGVYPRPVLNQQPTIIVVLQEYSSISCIKQIVYKYVNFCGTLPPITEITKIIEGGRFSTLCKTSSLNPTMLCRSLSYKHQSYYLFKPKNYEMRKEMHEKDRTQIH